MRRVALIQSQQPGGKPGRLHLLGPWGAMQNCHAHICQKWARKGIKWSFKIQQRLNVLLPDDVRKRIIIITAVITSAWEVM